MKFFFLYTIIEVLPSKLPTWMWNEESPVNYWLPAMVNSICHQWKSNRKSFFTRYMPQNPSDPKETCRSVHKHLKHSSLLKQLFSVKNARRFLRNMKDASGSNCNCLPDCELTDLQHSLATTSFMWVTTIGWPVNKTRCLKWFKQPVSSTQSQMYLQAMWLAQP